MLPNPSKTALAALATLASLAGAGATTEKYRLIWNSAPESSITVGWCQKDGEDPKVLFREKGADPSTAREHGVDNETSHLKLDSCFARLTGLKPDTAYSFTIKDSNSESPEFWFKTAPAGEAGFSFCAGGDSRNHRDARQRANRAVAKLRPLFVCFGGDMINRPTDKEWAEWLDDWELTTGEDGRMIPIIAARGNHEGKRDIHSFFDSPNPDDYYAVGFGDYLRVYTLNSNITRGGSQGEWLAEDLAAHAGTRWKVAHYHHPFRPHQSGKREQHEQYNVWAPLFFEHGLNMAIECDSHVVKRTWPVRPSNEPGSDMGFIRDDENGITFVGEGCWGAPLRRNDDDKQWTRASGSFNQINWIWVEPEHITVRTILVDDSGDAASVSDSSPLALPEGMNIWEPESGSIVKVLPRGKAAAAGTLARVKVLAEETRFSESTIIRIETDGELPEGAKIYFTTNGTEPSDKAYLYKGPFKLSVSAKIRAAVFHDGSPMTKSSLLEIERVPGD